MSAASVQPHAIYEYSSRKNQNLHYFTAHGRTAGDYTEKVLFVANKTAYTTLTGCFDPVGALPGVCITP